jgi:DNA-directed RNA polymerase specialized sigma24 family protein
MSRLLALRPERAFERMYRRHVADVYRYALAVLRDPEDAEQVTHATFSNAYLGLKETRKDYLNWLLSIAHDICSRRIRYAAEDPDGDPAADDVARALSLLPFDQREVIVLREVEGRSYGEIAELLTISPRTVETLIFSARRSLREGIEAALDCREAQRAFSRDLDGQSTVRERRLLRDHVRECAACDLFAREQHAQRAALRQLAQVELPEGLADRKFPPSAASP